MARSSMAILALAAPSPMRGLGPLPISSPALEVVGGEGRVGGVDRVQRRVQRDDQEAGVIARGLDRVDDGLGVGGGDQDTLGAIGDAGLDRRDLAFMVAVDLAGIGFSSIPSSLALASAPSFILTKKGLVSVLVIRQALSARRRIHHSLTAREKACGGDAGAFHVVAGSEGETC
jgi:hypothetical protein